MHSEDHIREILARARAVAIVGFSAKTERPSHSLAHMWLDKGKRVIPVNPGLAGQTFLGEKVYADVADIPDPVDLIDLFVRPAAVSAVVDASLARVPLPETIWMQLGISDPVAAQKAKALGVSVVQNKCPKIEYHRLLS